MTDQSSSHPFRVALCQLAIGDDPARNLAAIEASLAECDADLAVFPEASLVRFGNDLVAAAQPLDGEFVTGLREAARRHSIAVVAGTFEPADSGRVHNTAVVVDAEGELVGSYRKIHLFDAFAFSESDTVSPGREPLVVDVGRKIGLVTCYDLRFPELFRSLVDRGAEMFVVIAAWTPGPYKEDHWITLARARAIENTMWTVAVGKAPEIEPPPSGGPTGIGRSLLIDPMGVVRTDLGGFPGTAVGTVDDDATERIRRLLPSASHRRIAIGEVTEN
ncbi:putative amidohydrolase [Stackebrandtia endophytica]|uniref:Putative amidohydrolase n=1 Tax=Stackebrandtia endophytica TaxID=1496996 RepID=A0A543AQ05_9ACTN|nr:carbon-nitrogen hydrolase family protein [Stackebrandtia endophytica]TQL74658.1 putative amidohydrolase [Stackebrandtia endophytica]